MKKPCTSQVLVFPMAHKACGVSGGGARGPVMIDIDFTISDKLRPKITRLYGRHTPLFILVEKIAYTIVADARNEIEAVTILINNDDSNKLVSMVRIPDESERETSFSAIISYFVHYFWRCV